MVYRISYSNAIYKNRFIFKKILPQSMLLSSKYKYRMGYDNRVKNYSKLFSYFRRIFLYIFCNMVGNYGTSRDIFLFCFCVAICGCGHGRPVTRVGIGLGTKINLWWVMNFLAQRFYIRGHEFGLAKPNGFVPVAIFSIMWCKPNVLPKVGFWIGWFPTTSWPKSNVP
jgi:hypothetical protein